MATDYQIKFLKKGWGLSGTTPLVAAASEANPYAICFDTTTKQIYVGGVAYGGAISDANYANGVLTITKSNGKTQTLDFNDVASAEATLKVFAHMNELMGVTTVGSNTQLNYSGTNYLGTGIDTLVAADKALDAQIKAVNDEIDAMDATNVRTVTDTTTGDVISLTINGINQADGTISANSTLSTVIFAAVAKTGEADDVTVSSISTSSTATNVQEALEELANQITAGDLSIDGQRGAFTTDANSFVTISSSNKNLEVKLNSNGYITKDANGLGLQHVDTAGNSTTDTDLATVKTVTTYISSNVNALDVTGYEQVSVSGSEIKIYGIKEDDGKISHDATKDTTIVLGSNYDATSNKVALQSNITDAINTLDTQADVQAVNYTAADGDNGAKLTFKGVSETNGVIAQGSGATELQFAKVATSGTAADVAIVDGDENFTATNVESALAELAGEVDALVGGMRYNGGIANSTATLNTSTHDIRPGDIYLAIADFTLDGKSVEAGDMIIYKGTQSSSTVTLDSSNCNIIERETDTMVTAGDTLANGYLVLGSGNKSVVTSSITATDLETAMTNANSALQSIGKGTDGQYVITTVSAKDGNNNQNVSVALTTSTVTSTATALSGTDGVLTNDAIAPIKSYIDAKVGSTVENLDASDTVTGTNISFEYKETDGVISIGTMTETYATISQSGDTTTTEPSLTVGGTTGGLVKGNDISTVKTYIDNKVGYEINHLDSIGTSAATGAVAQVVVEEADGKIGTVTVTNISAGVTGNDTTLSATTDTGAVTGADIAKIKAYIDGQIGTAAAVTDIISTITVNDTNRTNIATIGTTNITAAVALVWDQYE